MRKSMVVTPSVLLVGFLLSAGHAFADIPDISNCYYVPQAGSLTAPLTGTNALRYFRLCPNNDGTQSLGNNARIKIVIRDSNVVPVPGIQASDIDALFNGGTQAQGFSGVGSDSIIANSQWNPTCPDMSIIGGQGHGMIADGPTDSLGITYMTFTGVTTGNPGVGVRDPNRKWGHYDTLIPVFLGGFLMSGRLTEDSPAGSFALEIKNVDSVGGLLAVMNQGERVNSLDIAPVQNEVSKGIYNFWHDFDWNGTVNSVDLSFVQAHNSHNCTSPLNP